MKILSIGNSFSEDAHKWLHDIAKCDNYSLDTINLCIGGCSLEMHYNNLTNAKPTYTMQGNGGECIKCSTIEEVLEMECYDIITLQQVSGLSGKYETYKPYLNDVIKYIINKQPNANIYLHRTWSYELDSTHGSFKEYDYDSQKMYEKIFETTNKISEEFNIKIIPVGDVIHSLRNKSKLFDYKNGGISLCRDGFHLSLDYGRFVAAAVWYKFFTGLNVNLEKFVSEHEEFDISILKEIMTFVNNVK